MTSKLKITFLGTGSTLGVPQIRSHCAVRNSHLNMSLMVIKFLKAQSRQTLYTLCENRFS